MRLLEFLINLFSPSNPNQELMDNIQKLEQKEKEIENEKNR